MTLLAAIAGPKGSVDRRRVLSWLGAGAATVIGGAVVVLSLRVMTGHPQHVGIWLLALLALLPIGWVLAHLVRDPRLAGVALVESFGLAGVATLVCVVYLVLVVGIEGSPHGHERSILMASLAAAAVVGILGMPVRHRLVQSADRLLGGREPAPGEVVSGFAARMSRAIPMDELMLQLVESLRDTIAPAGAEIWTGVDGQLSLTVSMPARPADRIELGPEERVVVGQARIGGPTWTSVWLPAVAAASAEAGDHRAVPVAHFGALLGLVVVRRPVGAEPFAEEDELSLVELARQLGLALHNVRLDSALQESLNELAKRNEELQASRLRIVTAADMSRREIERNLHDGAQQHLVALAVKLGLARQIAEDGEADTVLTMLEALREDVQTTISELRELAHGIYPPLLRDRGLAEALRTAAVRCPLPSTVEVDLTGRYPEAVETAAYFCCLEAMQNAGKYAGDGAMLTLSVHGDTASLCFELHDDGVGFDTATTAMGNGFVNMQDRLGAIGGQLDVESVIGEGTTVRATIPATPLA